MSNPIPPDEAKQIADLLFAGQKIEAIKVHRAHTGQGLKESKDFVEAVEAELRAREPGKFVVRPSGKGCLGLVVFGIGLLIVVVVLRVMHH